MVVAMICCLLMSMAFAWLLAETEMLTIRLPMGRNPEPITTELSETETTTTLETTIIASENKVGGDIESNNIVQEGTPASNQGRERPQ
jgi:hypothetical protein